MDQKIVKIVLSTRRFKIKLLSDEVVFVKSSQNHYLVVPFPPLPPPPCI